MKAITAPEAYIQQELRKLHALVEAITGDNSRKVSDSDALGVKKR